MTDSTADLPADLREAHNITTVPLHVQIEGESFRDGIDITVDEFYTRLVESATLPTTSTPPVGAFIKTYEQLLEETDTILSVHLSRHLSGTVETARRAAQLVTEGKQARIVVVDTNFAQMIVGYIAIATSIAAREGKPLEALLDIIESIRSRAFIYIGFDTLKYLERGGRIGHARALMGKLLQVKPIVQVEGEVKPLEQVRTFKRMLNRMAELTREQGQLEDLAVLYSTNKAHAETLRDQIIGFDLMPAERMLIVQAGSVIGTHIGPNGIGLAGIRRAS
ncbi:MAG: DegV family protein [Chloroflexaceae bacterium]|nr:DegV family protein [Chloroflexaceae bacterium]